MESRTRPGGSGFFTLTLGGQRIAYLQCINHLPPMPVAPDQVPEDADEKYFNTITLSFYELWNEGLWEQLYGEPYGALRMQARYGNLGLLKIIKSSISGQMRANVYDIQHARWQADWCVDGDWHADGETLRFALPKQFTLSHVKMIGFA